jgi:hypothetical protein
LEAADAASSSLNGGKSKANTVAENMEMTDTATAFRKTSLILALLLFTLQVMLVKSMIWIGPSSDYTVPGKNTGLMESA